MSSTHIDLMPGNATSMRSRLMISASKRIAILVSLAAWSCTDSPAPSNVRTPESPGRDTVALAGAFAFVNETGTELLSLDRNLAPDSYSAAICGQGRYPVRYVRTQGERPETTHRQVAGNFANEPGNVFQLEGGSATPNETCFLTIASALPRIAAAPRPLDRAACGASQMAQLARLAGRNVVKCWRLAEIEGGSQFVAVQFIHVDTSALAAVALVRDTVLLFHALPARYSGPGESSWRVDDGGVFDPSAIRLLFTAVLPRGHAAALLWAGAEGESDELVIADSTVRTRSAVVAYRYWSP